MDPSKRMDSLSSVIMDIGVGAKIIGPVRIADNVRIGANAVVVSSFDEPGITVVGVPARVVRRHS